MNISEKEKNNNLINKKELIKKLQEKSIVDEVNVLSTTYTYKELMYIICNLKSIETNQLTSNIERKYVISVTNTFGDREIDIYGLYTFDEAMETLKETHKGILDRMSNDEIYDNATIIDKHLDNGYFSIDWGDDTYTDYNVIEVSKN